MKTALAAALMLAALAPNAMADTTQAGASTHYTARVATDKPILVLIHGGGWAGNSNEQTRPLAERMHRAGYPVVNASYRLSCYVYLSTTCPRVDKLLLDVTRQVRWARMHHAELGTSNRQVVVVGLSAGGHLATLLAARGIADAAIGFSAPTDLAAVVPYLEQNVSGLMGCRLNECPDAWRAASATSYRTLAPMYLAYGQHEAMVPAAAQGDPMHAADANALIVRLPGAGHCCTDNWEYPIMPKALAYVERQLAGARGGPASTQHLG